MRSLLRLLAVLTVVAASLISPIVGSAPAQQADAADLRLFDPGNIISDAVFFDGLAMDAGTIQAFLDSKSRGTCPDPKFDSSPCLKDYSMETFSRAGDNLCAGYQGARWESAATVIAKVAVSCRVSPRVLLVLLEKEMSFITSSNPTAKMYDRAAGYACPDNADGWCNPEYAGLANQLYRSAWQFQRYAAYPGNYSFRSGRDNVIQWHPNTACGTSVVHIHNQATAGLYNYTPYRPNQAALDAGTGTGNSCSSYGNRNFWILFTNWFGSTQSAGAGAIQVRYNELGGTNSWLGAPTTGYHCGLRDYGCFQHYQNGSIYWTPSTRARPVQVPIRDRWALAGWELGTLGYPTSDPGCGLVNNGCFQVFEGGSVYWSPASGAHFVRGSIRELWANTGWEAGPLGYPVSDDNCGLRDGGCFTAFQNGSVYSSKSTGTHMVWAPVRTKWAELGWESGALGYPVTSTLCNGPRNGCLQAFQGGVLYWSADTGAWLPRGSIKATWVSLGAEWGILGYPTSDENCGLPGGGCYQTYQGGSIHWGPTTGAHLVSGHIRAAWDALGREGGALGYPLANTQCTGPAAGCLQPFQGGVMYWSPATGAWVPRGAVKALWVAVGAEWGVLGYPTGPEYCGLPGGGCFQTYQGGSVYWSGPTGAHFVNGPIRDAWAAASYERGAWGYPTANPMATNGGITQRFQHGTATWNATTGAVTFG